MNALLMMALLSQRSEELTVWEKYNIATAYEEVTGSSTTVTRSSSFRANSTYSFNSGTGIFTVAQTTSIANSSTGATNAKNKYYITLSSTSQTKTGDVCYHITNASYSSSNKRLTLTVTPLTADEVQTKGSYIEDVSSADPNAYPANGIQDGYWYVLKSGNSPSAVQGPNGEVEM